MQLTDLYNSIPALLIIAVFVYSVFGVLHKIKFLEKFKWFKYVMLIGPPILGAILGGCLPVFFPETLTFAARAIFGSIAGFQMGLVIGLLRRYVKAAKKSGTGGLPTVIDATVSLIEKPVGADGKTLQDLEKVFIKKDKKTE